jgi:Rieske Fe-S protein
MSKEWEPNPPYPYDTPGKIDTPQRRSRRQFLKGAIGVVIVGVAGYFGWTRLLGSSQEGQPAVGGGPPAGYSGKRTALGALTKFETSKDPTQVTVDNQIAFVDASTGKPTLLSGVCTHQGCAVAWNDQQNQYVCPCHNSAFGRDGSVTRGPAALPLPHIPCSVEGGTVYAEG